MDVPVTRRLFLRVSLLASSTAVTGGILAACAAPPPPAASKSDAPASKPAIDAAAKPAEAPTVAAKPADAKPAESAAKPAASAPTAAAQPAAAAKPAEKAAAAAPVAAPATQGQVITWKWQSAFGNTDVFHQMGVDLIQKIDEMSNGRLKIELLPNGAIVPFGQIIDATHQGLLDGGIGVPAYWFGKNKALSLWGTGPSFGMDADMMIG